MSLLARYEEMQKLAAEQQAAEQEQIEKVAFLTKYASAAEELLEKEYGNDYNADDVEKLAEYLIVADMEASEEAEKVAEYDEAGRIMARAFMDEVQKNK